MYLFKKSHTKKKGFDSPIACLFFRFFYTTIFFLCALFFPWWMTLIIGFLGIVFFEWYLEAVFVGFFLDVLYGGVDPTHWVLFGFFYSSIFFLCVVLCEWLKPKLARR